MINTLKKILFVTVALLLIAMIAGAAEGPKGDNKSLPKTTRTSHWNFFTINKLFNIYNNNGDGSISPIAQEGAMEFPKGSGLHAHYEDGMVVGGMYMGKLADGTPSRRVFVNGSTYGSGMQPGRILTPGTGLDRANAQADNAEKEIYRNFRVRPDINPTADKDAAMKKLESEETGLISRYYVKSPEQVYNEYIQDWNEWPGDQGAPYKDVDGNGKYDPTVDIPGIPAADQTLWHVYNDMNEGTALGFYASYPVGFEIQRTIWGYNRESALGRIIFMKYRVINKSGARFDSTFYSMWADVDLGDAGDDLAGCDRTLNLGYTYNGRASDPVYGQACPAVGYVFFQGPLYKAAATDSGIFDLKRVYGYKNLPMTSFNVFINSNAQYGDPSLHGTYANGTLRWWNLMRGFIGPSGAPWISPKGDTTKFVCDGDPITNTGWVDGVVPAAPGDRRICLITGPFSMEPNEVQEAVVALCLGVGADRLASVTALRSTAKDAQDTYDNLFQVAQPPPAPAVVKAELDGQIVLTWGDATAVAKTESFGSRGYDFFGYRVYQLKGQALDASSKQLGEYTLLNGVRRFYTATTDAIRGGKLVNGVPYYFGVAALGKNPRPKEGDPEIISGSPTIVQVLPQSPAFGAAFGSKPLQTVTAKKVGAGDGSVAVRVIDPTVVETGDYSIQFNAAGKYSLFRGTTKIGDYDVATQSSILTNGIEATLSGISYDSPLDVLEAPTFTKVAGSGLAWNGTNTYFGFHTGMYQEFANVTTPKPASITQWDLELRFTGVPKDAAKPTDSEIVSGGQFCSVWPRDARSLADVSAFTPVNVRGPFEIWDVENNKQINYSVVDRNADALSPWGNTQTTFNAYTGTKWVRWPGRAYITVNYTPYNAAAASTMRISPMDANSTWFLYFTVNGVWKTGDKALLKFSNPVLAGTDKYTFTLDGKSISKDAEKEQVKKVNVYPNPYFAFNRLETDRYNRYVTFNHLPEKATIRIFTITGQLVRTIVKNSKSQFSVWNLTNDASLPVGSGIFVCYVDMPDLGATKVLKLSVVQPVQILDRAM